MVEETIIASNKDVSMAEVLGFGVFEFKEEVLGNSEVNNAIYALQTSSRIPAEPRVPATPSLTLSED